MLNRDILQSIYRVVRKEARGGVITPDDFNRMLAQETIKRYGEMRNAMEKSGEVTTSMEKYIRTTIVNGASFAIPANYEKRLSSIALYNGVYTRRVDEVTQLEYEERVGNSLTKPTARNPVIYPLNGNFIVDPSSTIKFTYMVAPATPFLDYYYDVNGNIQFLTAGQAHTLLVGETYRDGTIGTNQNVNSITVEIDMDYDDKIAIMNGILRQLGVIIPNEGAFAYGTQEQQKEKP